MERFAINILHKKIQNICRLCGVDNPVKVPIIEEDEIICIDDEDEATLVKKIEECVGIRVYKDDKMPQQICSLCIDKVNDFYEYRLMCAATNIQTRSILNLPLVQPTSVSIKTEPSPDPEPLETIESQPNSKRGLKTKNRKNSDAGSENIPGASCVKRIKTEYVCQYCDEPFDKSPDLERHLAEKHVPMVRKFGCGTCAQLFDTASQYKEHNLWHKWTRTVYNCYGCKRTFVKSSTLQKHLETSKCGRPKIKNVLVPDMRCKLCNKTFKTMNLYEWHNCLLRARTKCPKCGKYFRKKNLLIRHYILYCTGTLVPMQPVLVPKEEPVGALESNDFSEVTQPAAPAQVKKSRGRPRKRRSSDSMNEKMKEETTELPFPPLLDAPAVKSENMSSGENVAPADESDDRKRLKVSFEAEANKINTLLRSGAEVNENSDFAEISSILTSVNEAIATISSVRKSRKHKTVPSKTVQNTDDVARNGMPMVQLSVANIKQEVCENAATPKPISVSVIENENNAASSSPETNSDIHENNGSNVGNAEDTIDDGGIGGDMGEEGFGGFDSHDSNDHTEADESGHEEESTRTASVTQKEAASVNSNGTDTPDATQHDPPIVQVKKEPITYHSNSEADDSEYESPMSYLAIKHEPVDEDCAQSDFVATESHRQRKSVKNSQHAASYAAVRIKIKKEKGLLNASVVDEAFDPIQTDRSSEATKSAPSFSRQQKARKEAKTPNHYKIRPMRIRPALLLDREIHVKQEQLDPEREHHLNEEGTVRIKQENLDSLVEHSNHYTPELFDSSTCASRSNEIAFDGMRIKQESTMTTSSLSERSDSGTNEQQNSYHNSPAALRQTVDPLSHAKEAASSRPGRRSNQETTSHKQKKRINPFALLQRKSFPLSDVPVILPNQGSRSSTESVILPATQTISIDSDERLAKSVDSSSIEAVATNEDDAASVQSKVFDESVSDKWESINSSLSAVSGKEISKKITVENVVAQRATSQLRIASVSTIKECTTLIDEKCNASSGQAHSNREDLHVDFSLNDTTSTYPQPQSSKGEEKSTIYHPTDKTDTGTQSLESFQETDNGTDKSTGLRQDSNQPGCSELIPITQNVDDSSKIEEKHVQEIENEGISTESMDEQKSCCPIDIRDCEMDPKILDPGLQEMSLLNDAIITEKSPEKRIIICNDVDGDEGTSTTSSTDVCTNDAKEEDLSLKTTASEDKQIEEQKNDVTTKMPTKVEFEEKKCIKEANKNSEICNTLSLSETEVRATERDVAIEQGAKVGTVLSIDAEILNAPTTVDQKEVEVDKATKEGIEDGKMYSTDTEGLKNSNSGETKALVVENDQSTTQCTTQGKSCSSNVCEGEETSDTSRIEEN